MPVRVDGATQLSAELGAQAARMRAPQPALNQASTELGAIRRAHPTWNRPPSWIARVRELVAAYVTRGVIR